MFQKDDIVMYGTPGVCRISGIIEKDFGGDPHPYYELRPVYDEKSTLFVPVENEMLTKKMHRVLSAEEIDTMLTEVPNQEPEWIADETARKQHYKEILRSGDRPALLNAIKSLWKHQQLCRRQGKKIHVCDERFFKDAERILYDEFAYVLRIDRDKVLRYILDKIESAEAVD